MATINTTITINPTNPASEGDGFLPAPITNSYTNTVNNFSRFKTIFAGETLFHPLGQPIPLSGSSNGTPDGTRIMARPLRSLDKSNVSWGGWRAIATVSNNSWSGQYPLCKREGLSWLVFEVVVEGSDQVTTMGSLFGVGVVGLVEAQSEFHRILQQTRDNNLSYDIGHVDDYFQLTWRGVDGSDEDAVTAGGIYTLNDNTSRNAGGGYKTFGMDRMAAVCYRNNVMVRVCLDTRSGAPETEPLRDGSSGGTGTPRKMSNTFVMASNLKADGQRINAVHSDHFKLYSNRNQKTKTAITNRDYLMAAYYGQAPDGSQLPGVNYNGPFPLLGVAEAPFGGTVANIQVTWADDSLYPEFRTADSPIHLEGFPWRKNTGGIGFYDPEGVRVVNLLPNDKFGFFTGDWDLMALNDSAHAANTEFAPKFGQTRNGANVFVGMLMSCGVMPNTKHAQFDRYMIAGDGSYVLFWFSEGPVTTIERTFAQKEGRPPVNLAKPGYQNVQAAGFLEPGSGEPYSRVEIVAADGVTLADSGAIKVYANSGTTFGTGNIPTYLQRRSGVNFTTGDDFINGSQSMDISHYPHIPVYDPLLTLEDCAPMVNSPGERSSTARDWTGAFGSQIEQNAVNSSTLPDWT